MLQHASQPCKAGFRVFCIAIITMMIALESAALAAPREIRGKDSLGREYYLYLPAKINPLKTYRLVVGVHGYRCSARGAAGLKNWANRGDCIVLSPQFPHQGYQYLQLQADKQLIDLFKQLKTKYRLHDKMFLFGFSGGSQYSHRFALQYPKLVFACSAGSGGTWATNDYPNPDTPITDKARAVVFAIHCGLNDTRKSFRQAPLGRLEWAKKFSGLLHEKNFVFKEMYWPNTAHQRGKDCFAITEECYWLGLGGMTAKQGTAILRHMDSIYKRIRRRDYKKAEADIKKLLTLKTKPPKLPRETRKSNAPRRANQNNAGWYGFADSDKNTWLKTRRDAYLDTLAKELRSAIETMACEEIKHLGKKLTAAEKKRIKEIRKLLPNSQAVQTAADAALGIKSSNGQSGNGKGDGKAKPTDKPAKQTDSKSEDKPSPEEKEDIPNLHVELE